MKKINSYYLLLALLVIVYVGFALTREPDAEALTRYGLSASSARLLTAAFLLPIIAIWSVAFTAFIKVKEYAKSINKTKEGSAFNTLGTGLMLLALSLPITSIVSSVRTYLITQDSSLQSSLTILYNYLVLGFTLVSFYFIGKGAKQLVETLKGKYAKLKWEPWAVVFVAVVGIFAYVTLNNPARQVPLNASSVAAYYLPDWLLVTTIIIPYILFVFWGFQAAYNIYVYRQNVAGTLYRRILAFLASGIMGVVTATMLLRVLTSMATLFEDLSLRLLIAIIYILLAVIAAGYVLIAIGAHKLQKIEDV